MKRKIKVIVFILLVIGTVCLSGCAKKYSAEYREEQEFVRQALIVCGSLAECLIMGGVCHAIVSAKGYHGDENYGFLWGFFLSLIGLIVCCAKPTKVIQTRSTTEEISLQTQLNEAILLRKQGYITEEEFIQMRKNILKLN